ncbi:MAG TPA: serine/threonine-protein kinase [Polyangiaceae bacterium]|jgi:serine/threonine-protein kinase
MSSMVREGDVLAGKFRIERVLGQGGMGVVVAATHLQLDERVALKFLLPEAMSNPEAVARFAREARAAVKIKSEHVARVSDVGTLDTGSPYMVMEYLQGHDMAALVQQRGAFAVADAVDFVLQACEALAEAHALGIVHRDLKPANLFVTARADGSPCVKVLDFGISKLTTPGSASDMGMTKTSSVMGSPLYMSPEQMSSTRDVDARTDIWAVGIILYEIIAGRVPFLAETMPQLCAMILQEPPRALRDSRPDAPSALQEIIVRCLEKDRTRRFANVAELAHALAPFGSANAARSAERISKILRASARPSLSGTSNALSVPGAATSANFGATSGARSSNGALLLLIPMFGLFALGAGVLGYLLWRKHAPPTAVTVVEPAAAAVAPSVAPSVEPAAPQPALAAPAPSTPAARIAPQASAASVSQGKLKPVAAPTPKVAAPSGPKPSTPAFDPLDGRK